MKKFLAGAHQPFSFGGGNSANDESPLMKRRPLTSGCRRISVGHLWRRSRSPTNGGGDPDKLIPALASLSRRRGERNKLLRLDELDTGRAVHHRRLCCRLWTLKAAGLAVTRLLKTPATTTTNAKRLQVVGLCPTTCLQPESGRTNKRRTMKSPKSLAG